MVRTPAIALSVLLFATFFSTPAPAPQGPRWDKSHTTQTAKFPPDPYSQSCLKFKQRIEHERCVTRQMNMSAAHGGIWGQGEQSPYVTSNQMHPRPEPTPKAPQ